MPKQPPDVPLRRRCAGLPPGSPCPSHDDGTWPVDCQCYQEGILLTEDSRTGLLIAGLAAVTLALIVVASLMVIEHAIGAETNCLTKQQARAKYQTSHLYWHTEHHCWDDHSGHSRMTSTPAIQHVSIAPGTDVARRPTIAYPSLMIGAGTDDAMLRPDAMTAWPLIADFDVEPIAFQPWQDRVAGVWDR